MLGVELPAVVLLAQSLVHKVSDVADSARSALVEQDNFNQLACYLERIVPICIELQRGRDTSPMIREILEALMRDVECANHLIELCSTKSRLYLLTHCRSVTQQLGSVVYDLGRSLSLIPLSSVQGHEDTKAVIDSLARDMQQAQFEVKESDDRICQLLREDSIHLQNDPELQTGLLIDIARSVGIDDFARNPSALKLQVELLRNDLQFTTEAYDLQMMDMLGNMVENWVQNTNSASFSDDSSARLREHKRVEPLYESFVCPLTKNIMRDPVTLENGMTYERVAIERWFRECRENGRPIVCPMTGKELESAVLKPSIALRQTIEEWTARNEAARIDNAMILLTSRSSEEDALRGLKDIQVLAMKNKLNKHKVRTAGLIPVIVDCLKLSEHVRCFALATLRILAEDDDDNKETIAETDAIRNCVKCLSRVYSKEREEAVSLLYELSKFYPLCEKIGSVNGTILLLVGTTSSKSENVLVVQRAEQTLENLETCDQNVRQMAENGRLQPLLQRLVNGSEELRLEMVTFLAEVVLSKEGKIKVAELGGKALVDMLDSGYLAGREASLKSLCQLSDLESNGKVLAKAGILRPLVRDLFVVGVNQLPTKSKEVSATTLANVVNSGVDLEQISIDGDGNTLTSEVTIHNFLHLISNSGPAIEAKLLQVLVGLASSADSVGKVVSAIRSAGAVISLIQFLEAPQKDLRVNSVKLLNRLTTHMGQELADGLRVTTGQLSTLVKLVGAAGLTEEHAASARLLAGLPIEDAQLTLALLEERALPIVVKQLEELGGGVVQIGTSRFIDAYKEGLVGILSRFTYVLHEANMLSLAQQNNLTSLFTKLLKTSIQDEIQRLCCLALANLSVSSKQLSGLPIVTKRGNPFLNFFPCTRRAPAKPEGLCPVHGGVCSAKQTFCLLQAGAVELLVACLEHRNASVVEAALTALCTLVSDSVNWEEGVGALDRAHAIGPILEVMREHKTEMLRQQAVILVECMLRNSEIARTIANDPNVHTAVVEAFKHGNNRTRHTAEKALKHLNKIPNYSGVFHKF